MGRLDFASSLYLGLRHPSDALPAYASLTTGAPATVGVPVRAQRLASGLAKLIGCEAATLGTSTLHVFFDLFSVLARRGVAIVVAGEIYPIARWGIERAATRFTPVVSVPSEDPCLIRRAVGRLARRGLHPILVSDGLAVLRGTPAPLDDYLRTVRHHKGLLVIDDTQALGVLGSKPRSDDPYGRGGGGSLRWHGSHGPEIVAVSSLAKGFGAPVAVLAGSRPLVQTFEARSETRSHCSPPSAAVIGAGLRAMAVNRAIGDALRRRLLRNVVHFRARLAGAGLAADGGLFPVQTLRGRSDAITLHRDLARQGIDTLLPQPDPRAPPRLAFVLSARHRRRDIDRAVRALAPRAGARWSAPAGGSFDRRDVRQAACCTG
jgi:8-amino-7-oxononanoate synthase